LPFDKLKFDNLPFDDLPFDDLPFDDLPFDEFTLNHWAVLPLSHSGSQSDYLTLGIFINLAKTQSG
jgi:hypothetical protein